MKLLRIWFVVLLAVLLPIRGAMAATMPCAPAGDRGASELHMQGADPHAEHPHHGDHSGDPDQGVGEDGATVHEHADQKCNLCSASCSVPPLPSSSAGIDEPTVLTAVSFPDLCAPAPTFQSDGQERPPRTI